MLLTGKGAAPGIAVGKIYIYRKNENIPLEAFVSAGEEQSHLDRYLEIKKIALAELDGLIALMQSHDPEKTIIFLAHKEILDDIVINEEIPARILNERWAGDWAIYQVYETVLSVLRKTHDPLIAERAADFDDVRSLLLRLWYGEKIERLSSLKEPVIVAASELLPSDTVHMDKNNVLAIITEKGGVTSHTVIIAKSFGIPAVLGLTGLLDIVKQGQMAAVNADDGKVILDPDGAVVREYTKKCALRKHDKHEEETFRKRECFTADGTRIEIGLNISGINSELDGASFTDFAGLFRTEFLFLGRNTLPSEDEQVEVYKKALESYKEKPVILRTMDIGGDKQLSCLELESEENPFLGKRGIRLSFSHPGIFKTQIRAALRASVYGNLWVMFPMITSVEDIYKAKEFVAEAKKELLEEGSKIGEIKTGIMIETPAIALTADIAVKEVDFASIGSNDLCQYMCAADRMNSAVESYYQSYHPAVFRIIKEAAAAFTKAGKPISICGELGGDTLAAPALIGLGLRKLSMSASCVAAVKRSIASITVKKCEETAEKILRLPTAAEIEKYLNSPR